MSTVRTSWICIVLGAAVLLVSAPATADLTGRVALDGGYLALA